MKMLNGSELADFIKERQARQVRALLQAWQVQPKLAIVLTVSHPVIRVYTRMKKRYGADILVDVDIHHIEQKDATKVIADLNNDPSIHGIIVQLPLEDPTETDKIVNMVAPEKDVDALGDKTIFDPATPMAILWLLAGYNIDLQQGRRVVLVGRGKLVGRPLEKMLTESGVNVVSVDRNTENIAGVVKEADVIVTATGSPSAVTSDMIKQGAIVVDAGVAGEEGKTVGDLAPDVYDRDDLTITPQKGGVGPLTVCALFDNVIRAARLAAESKAPDYE